MAAKSEDLKKILTAEEKKRKEEEEKKKRLGRVKVAAAPETRYDYGKVDDIVKRMKKRYEERGEVEEKGLTEAKKLKQMVIGKKARTLDQRVAKDLVISKKPMVKLVGTLFSKLKFLNKLSNRISTYSLASSLYFDLDSANMNCSPKQYCALALTASIAAMVFIGLFSLVLAFLGIGSMLDSTFLPMMGFALEKGVALEGNAMIVSILLKFVMAGIATILGFVIALLISIKFPSSTAKKRGTAIDKDLAFALRHMATEIRAGVGIHRTMESVVEAKYGILSEEFEKTLKDIEKGVNTEDALDALATRSPSENLSKAMRHVIRALKTGGNLSEIIESIAADVSFELRMKMRDFVERLNLIGLFYMMIGIVFPVFVAVLAGIFNAIPTIGMGSMLGPEILFLIYFLLVPMALGLILYVIKVMQPM